MKRIKLIFNTSCVCLAISSLAICSIPISFLIKSENRRIILNFIGLLFWLGIICGHLLQHFVHVMILRFRRIKHIEKETRRKIGLICFCANDKAKTVDILCVVLSFILLLNSLFLRNNAFVFFIVFGILIFNIQMHGILNGFNYTFIIKMKGGKKDES